LNGEQMVSLANEWLESGSYSDALNDLFNMSNPTLSDAAPAFERAMRDFGVEEPTKIRAAEILINEVLSGIVKGTTEPVAGAEFLYWHVYNALSDWQPDEQYFRESLDLDYVFFWLREVWDCRDGSILSYYADLPRDEAERKQIENLVSAAREFLQAQPNNSLQPTSLTGRG
jgi:hypothetical protein